MEKLNVIFALLILFVACEKDNNIVNSDYSEYIVENSVSTDIDFFPVEMYDKYDEPDTASLKIHLITTEIFPCVNYYLATTVFVKDKELIIRFDSIQKPTICLTAIGPANSYVDLPTDITTLTLINGQDIDKYQIAITDEIVEIESIASKYTNLKYERTFRYPENTFAFICGTNLDNTYLYNDFLDIIVDSTSAVEFEFNGDGRIPYPDSSSGHWSDNASVFFKYENETEFDEAGDLLKKFAQENLSSNDGVGISLTSWNNKKYMSWRMMD